MIRFGFIALFISIFVTGCFQQNNPTSVSSWMQQNGKPKVLCTTAMCSALVKEIGGDEIDCLTLIQGESDPHSYQLVKGDDEKFQRADIIFYSGLGLEHGPSLKHILEDNSKAYSLGEYIRTMRPESIIFVDKTVDPHVWMDMGLWKEGTDLIEKILSSKYPEYDGLFQERAQALKERLDIEDQAVREILSEIPEHSRYLVSTHDAFNYFAKAYLAASEERKTNGWEERARAPEGLAPDSQLSTADIQRLVAHIKRFNVPVLFAEANVNRDSIKKLVDSARRSGISVEIAHTPLYADSLGPHDSQAGTYIGMMHYDAETIRDQLGKK